MNAPKYKKEDYVNRGTQCAYFDEYGVPIPEKAAGLEGENGIPILTHALSFTLLPDE